MISLRERGGHEIKKVAMVGLRFGLVHPRIPTDLETTYIIVGEYVLLARIKI